MLPRDDPSAASVTVFIHPGSLGDILQAKGALVTASKDLRPGRVVLVTDASLRGLAESWGMFDDIIGFDPAHAYHGSVRTRVRTLIGLVRAIRSTAPTAVCVLKPSPIYGFIALMSGGRTGGLTRGIGHLLIGANQGVRDHEHREDRYLRAVRTVCAAGRSTRRVCGTFTVLPTSFMLSGRSTVAQAIARNGAGAAIKPPDNCASRLGTPPVTLDRPPHESWTKPQCRAPLDCSCGAERGVCRELKSLAPLSRRCSDADGFVSSRSGVSWRLAASPFLPPELGWRFVGRLAPEALEAASGGA